MRLSLPTCMACALVLVLLCSLSAKAQTISRFDFNSTATLTQATTGPNGTSVAAAAVAPAGISYITSGCGNGIGMDLVVPGSTFDVHNISIRCRFQRGASEGTGDFFSRDQLTFGFRGRRLRASFVTDNGSGGIQNKNLNSNFTVSATQFHEYEFTYDNCTGQANLLVDGTVVASSDLPDNRRLLWFGGDALIGSELDNACSQVPGLDWIEIGGNSDTCLVPLPVELGDFSGKMTESGALINWTTVSETNNDLFEVERSADGRSFTPFARLAGAGTTRQQQNYQVVDGTPFAGQTYYRLRQTDVNGDFTYSEILTLRTEVLRQGLEIGPNPSTGMLHLRYRGGTTPDVLVEVVDITGTVMLRRHEVLRDSATQALDLSQLADGIYFLRVTRGTQVRLEKIVLQR